MRTSSRISAFVSRISLSAFAVAALEACLRRCSAFLGSMGPADILRAVCGVLAALSFCRCCAALVHLRPTFLLRGWGDGLGCTEEAAAVRLGRRPPPLRIVMAYGLACKSKSLAPSKTFAP